MRKSENFACRCVSSISSIRFVRVAVNFRVWWLVLLGVMAEMAALVLHLPGLHFFVLASRTILQGFFLRFLLHFQRFRSNGWIGCFHGCYARRKWSASVDGLNMEGKVYSHNGPHAIVLSGVWFPCDLAWRRVSCIPPCCVWSYFHAAVDLHSMQKMMISFPKCLCCR